MSGRTYSKSPTATNIKSNAPRNVQLRFDVIVAKLPKLRMKQTERKIKVLIVDDEPLARRGIRLLENRIADLPERRRHRERAAGRAASGWLRTDFPRSN